MSCATRDILPVAQLVVLHVGREKTCVEALLDLGQKGGRTGIRGVDMHVSLSSSISSSRRISTNMSSLSSCFSPAQANAREARCWLTCVDVVTNLTNMRCAHTGDEDGPNKDNSPRTRQQRRTSLDLKHRGVGIVDIAVQPRPEASAWRPEAWR